MGETYEEVDATETNETSDAVTIATGWKNPPTLADLKQDYEDGKQEHAIQQAKIDEWLNYLNVTGAVKKTKIPGRSNVQPKLIRKQAEWRYPSLTEPFLSTEDIFNVYPTTGADVDRAKQNELVLNNQFNTRINKVQFIDSYVRAGVDEGTIIVRIGWKSEQETYTEDQPVYQFVPDMSGRAGQQYQAMMQMQQSNPAQFDEQVNEGFKQAIEILRRTGQIVIPHQAGIKKVEKKRFLYNHPTVEVCDSNNVILDPSCNGDITKAGFAIYNFETSKSELKKKGIYKNLDKIKGTSAPSPLGEPDYTPGKDISTFTFKDDARAKFLATEYWGYWDYNDTGVVEPFVATWVGDTLIRMEVSPFPDKELPFVIAVLMPVRRSLYGEPDGELLSDNQEIIGAITRGMIDIMGKSANGQTGIRKDFLDTTNARKFREGKDYQFNGNVDPRIGVFQHVYSEIPQSAYTMLQLQNSEAESFSGVKAYNSGISGDSLGNVAAGVRGALDAASRRETSILRRLAAGMVEIGRKIISLNADLLSEEEVIRITDTQFVTVRRDDLAGKFDIRLIISTAEEDNAKAQELAFMLQTGAASADPGEVRMIRAEIARLRKMPALAKRIEEYQPQPDPMVQQKQQMEIQVLQMQLRKESALAQKHEAECTLMGVQQMNQRADAMLTIAKRDTEQAKTRNLHSKSDAQDLDYLEQESGVHQERELQKIGEQAQSYTQMDIAKNHLEKDAAEHKAVLEVGVATHKAALDMGATEHKAGVDKGVNTHQTALDIHAANAIPATPALTS